MPVSISKLFDKRDINNVNVQMGHALDREVT